MKPTVEFFTDRQGQVRWRVRASNQRVLCASTRGYRHRWHAERALKALSVVLFQSALNGDT